MCAGPATSVCLFICKAVTLTSKLSEHRMWGIGWPRSMHRETPYALVGLPAKCPVSTAAVMCRFTVGSLTRVKFDWGGGGFCSFYRQTDMAKLIGDFCGLQIFAVNAREAFRCAYISLCVLLDVHLFRSCISMCVCFDLRTFRYAYISMCVLLDVRTFRRAYISVCVHFDMRSFRCAYISICVHFDVPTFRRAFISICIHFDVRTFKRACISTCVHLDVRSFRFAYISMCVLLEVCKFRCAYVCQPVYLPYI